MTKFGRHNYGDSIPNFLNNKARVVQKHNWCNSALDIIQEFKMLLLKENINSICVPFHCHYNNDYANLKKVFPESKIISIRPESLESFELIKLELVRKTVLIKIEKFKDIQYYYKIFPNKTINTKNFIGLDTFLLTHGLDINIENRNLMLQRIITMPLPKWDKSDYIISWDNFFKNLNNMAMEYNNLCTFLGLTPDYDILAHAVKRNKKNYSKE
jgi:hypothetical protein